MYLPMLDGQPRNSTTRNAVHQRPANGNWSARDVTGEMSETGCALSVRVRKALRVVAFPGDGKRKGDYFDALAALERTIFRGGS
jgi:hypothetical protein